MAWLELKDVKVMQYATSKEPNGVKKISSGKIEHKELKELIDKAVYVRIKGNDTKFIAKVKSITVNKKERPYISDTCLKEFIDKKIDIDVIEIE